MPVWMVLLVQPSGEAAQNAEKTGQGFAGMVDGISGFVSDWANGDYGWVLGGLVLLIVVLWAKRRTVG